MRSLLISIALFLLTGSYSISVYSQVTFKGKQISLSSNKSVSNNLDQLFSDYNVYKIDITSVFNTVKKDGSYNNINFKLGKDYDWFFSFHLNDVRSENFVIHLFLTFKFLPIQVFH